MRKFFQFLYNYFDLLASLAVLVFLFWLETFVKHSKFPNTNLESHVFFTWMIFVLVISWFTRHQMDKWNRACTEAQHEAAYWKKRFDNKAWYAGTLEERLSDCSKKLDAARAKKP